jgi:hypothetical protein
MGVFLIYTPASHIPNTANKISTGSTSLVNICINSLNSKKPSSIFDFWYREHANSSIYYLISTKKEAAKYLILEVHNLVLYFPTLA